VAHSRSRLPGVPALRLTDHAHAGPGPPPRVCGGEAHGWPCVAGLETDTLISRMPVLNLEPAVTEHSTDLLGTLQPVARKTERFRPTT
jgi:hypothetical protein